MRHYLGIASILCLVLIILIAVVFEIATDARGTIPVLAINPQIVVISMICTCPVISLLTIAGPLDGKRPGFFSRKRIRADARAAAICTIAASTTLDRP